MNEIFIYNASRIQGQMFNLLSNSIKKNGRKGNLIKKKINLFNLNSNIQIYFLKSKIKIHVSKDISFKI